MKLTLAVIVLVLTVLTGVTQSKKELDIKYELEDEFLPHEKDEYVKHRSKDVKHHLHKEKYPSHKTKLASYYPKKDHHQRSSKNLKHTTAPHHGTRLQYHLTKKDAWAHHDEWARKDLHLQDLRHHQIPTEPTPRRSRSHHVETESHKIHEGSSHHSPKSKEFRFSKHEKPHHEHNDKQQSISMNRSVHPFLRSALIQKDRHHPHQQHSLPGHHVTTKHPTTTHKETTFKHAREDHVYDKRGKKIKKAFAKKHGKKHYVKDAKAYEKFKW